MNRSFVWPTALAAIVLFMLGPLALVILFSFNQGTRVGFPISGFTFGWYKRLASEPEFWNALWNSLTIALPVAATSTVIGTLAALAVTASDTRIRVPFLAALTLPMMIPPLVIAIGLIVLFVRWMAVPLGLPTVIAGHILLTQPFVALMVAARMASFDRVCLDAAYDLGATPWQAFRKVTLPQIATVIVGAALIGFALSLDEFIITVFTIGSGNTLSTFVWGKMRTALDPSINAISTIVLTITIGSAALALRMTRYKG